MEVEEKVNILPVFLLDNSDGIQSETGCNLYLAGIEYI